MRESPIDRLDELIPALADTLEPCLSAPVFLFGHCSGAIVAFELARVLLRRARLQIAALIVAAQVSPRARAAANFNRDGTTPYDLRQRVELLGGTDPQILANDEVFSLLEPALRADFALTDSYVYRADAPLDVPITVIAGADDMHMRADALLGWKTETIRECEVRMLEGNHFFSGDDWLRLAREVASVIGPP